jgi:phospholipase/carboxylesterase
VISARAPYDLQFGSYAWYAIGFDDEGIKSSDHDQARISRDIIAGFIDELTVNYPIDADNVTLIGFSQGSILSYAVALSYPEKVQRVVAMSGYLNSDIMTDDFQNNDFSNLKIFVSHGTVDQVIPVELARNVTPVFDTLGIANVYKAYPVGHGVAERDRAGRELRLHAGKELGEESFDRERSRGAREHEPARVRTRRRE